MHFDEKLKLREQLYKAVKAVDGEFEAQAVSGWEKECNPHGIPGRLLRKRTERFERVVQLDLKEEWRDLTSMEDAHFFFCVGAWEDDSAGNQKYLCVAESDCFGVQELEGKVSKLLEHYIRIANELHGM